MKKLLAVSLLFVAVVASAQTSNSNYPESNLAPAYVVDGGAANVLTAALPTCPIAYATGQSFKVLPGHANTTTTPTLNVCGLGAKTITKFGQAALVSNDLTTTAIAYFLYDGTDMELLNPQTANSAGTVTQVVVAGTANQITATGTCTITSTGTCTFSLPSPMTIPGLVSSYDAITTAGLGFPVIEGISDVTAQSANQTTVNLLASTPSAGGYAIRYYIDQNAVCATPGPGQVYATFSWTDATHAHTANTIVLNFLSALSTTGGYLQGVIPLYSATASAISYTTTYTACTTGSATYDLHASVEQVR